MPSKDYLEKLKIIDELGPNFFKDLSEQQAEFVKAYVKSWDRVLAAKEAGYSEKGSKNTATRLMKKESVQLAIEALKKHLAKATEFDQKKAFSETIKLRDEARKKGQYSAAAKFHEQALKMTGHLKDGAAVNINASNNGKGGFNLQIVGVEKPEYATKQVIDVTPTKKQLDGNSGENT